MTGILNLLAGAVSSVIKDTYFNLVTLLLPGNGTNGAQNNTFLDSSSNNFTITRNGQTTQGTFSPFSQTGWSNNFASSSTDMLSTASNAAFAFGTGDFTMEAFVFATASQTDNWIIGLANNCWLRVGSAGKLEFYNNVAATSILASSAMPTNQWVHVAAVRSGTTLTIYQDGTSVASGTVSTNFSTNVACTVGNQSGVDRRWNGYLSNVRVVKGTAVYTSAFTPPTSALTAITNTSLLTCQSNRFIDNSTANSGSGFAITVNGTPSVQAFSPFAPTAAYSAATNGGSAYSDGNGDYLTVASDANLTLGSSDFTIELWWYPTAFNSDGEIFTMGSTGGTNRCYAMYSSGSNGTLAAFAGTGGTSWDIVSNLSMGTAIRNAWNHMAFTRSGSTFSTYLNGSRIATTTASGTLGSSGLGIFANNSGTSQAPSGYIGGARTIKGTALYTGTTYTVPTAPFTAVTNTNLLLNFTNAGITDATAKNDLETVGGAQISTTQSKFGGSSMYFDGSGDVLKIPYSPNIDFGTGDFTIELWAYITNLSPGYNPTMVARWGASGGQIFTMQIQAGGTFRIITAAGTWTGGSISANTWTHLAVTRSGSSLRLFNNGTLSSTNTDSTSLSGTQILSVGGENDAAQSVPGYLDDVRITKGYARYTTTFTPPTAAFALQ